MSLDARVSHPLHSDICVEVEGSRGARLVFRPKDVLDTLPGSRLCYFKLRNHWHVSPRPLLPFGSSQISAQTGAQLVEPSFVCDGVRLEMRPLRWSCKPLHEEKAPDISETTPSSVDAGQGPSNVSGIGAAADNTAPAPRDQDPVNGTTGTSLGEPQPNGGATEDSAADFRESLPQVPSAYLNHDDPAASVGARCHQHRAPAVLSQEFSHSELDALLGPKLRWKDPFEVRVASRNLPDVLNALGLQRHCLLLVVEYVVNGKTSGVSRTGTRVLRGLRFCDLFLPHYRGKLSNLPFFTLNVYSVLGLPF